MFFGKSPFNDEWLKEDLADLRQLYLFALIIIGGRPLGAASVVLHIPFVESRHIVDLLRK
jgi:hypothetical protein